MNGCLWQGIQVRKSNAMACMAVADTVRTMLGPRSSDKLFVEPDGAVLITNDGATALQCMRIEHPAARLLVDLSQAMDHHSGDGTTSVVILAAELLAEAIHLMEEEGFHFTTIIRGYMKTLQRAIDFLPKLAIPQLIAPESLIHKAVVTTLQSKFASQHTSSLASLAIQAAKLANGERSNIKIESFTGSALSDSRVFSGCILRYSTFGSRARPNMDLIRIEASASSSSSSSSGLKIAVLTFSLDKPSSHNHHKMVVVPSAAQIDRLIKEEESYIRDIVVKLKKLGVNVAVIADSLVSDPLPPSAKQWLKRAKITVLGPFKKQELDIISKCIGARTFSGPEQLASVDAASKLGTALCIKEESMGGEPSLIIETDVDEGMKNRPAVCIVLRAASTAAAEEAGRALQDAISVASNLLQDSRLVFGAGAVEAALASFLDVSSMVSSSIERRIAKSFSSALQSVPSSLAANCGLDSEVIVSGLMQHYSSTWISLPGGKSSDSAFEMMEWKGVNLEAERIGPVQVYEPLLSKIAQVTMACQSCCSVLRIDDTIS